jgi:type II secretory pathway predicted ATPase ExeA
VRYEDYYGFADTPFGLTPAPRYHFASVAHANAVESIEYAVRRGDRLIALMADSGTGKTTLCRRLPECLGREVITALVLDPVRSEEELLHCLLQQFGIVSREGAADGRLSSIERRTLSGTLRALLSSLASVGASALAVIDDAQDAPTGVLEALGQFSTPESGDRGLQVLLVGRPSLRDTMQGPELRPLDQRISMCHELKPLSRHETAGYITHRLAVAGGDGSVAFSNGAIARVYGCTRGVPRLVNLLCDRALVAACMAQTTRVLSGHVDRAAEALDLARPGRLLLAWAR